MFLRYNRKQEQRREMMERLIQGQTAARRRVLPGCGTKRRWCFIMLHLRSSDLAQGRSYWNRLRFLDVCETATEIFSRKYFNKHFLLPALELVHDPVANVRYPCRCSEQVNCLTPRVTHLSACTPVRQVQAVPVVAQVALVAPPAC